MPTTPRTTDELYEALRQNRRRPYGRPRTVTAEELAEAAEQFDEPLPLVHALLELHEAYDYGSEPRKSPVVFARLLNLFDERPDVFDETLRHQLFWRFKWVANALTQVPEVPLSALRAWLEEMRDRYRRAGLGLQPYYRQAYELAVHTGEDATAAFELWTGQPRTGLSDCEACETCARARHHLDAGDDTRALAVWEPVLRGQESCMEEPARSISYALLPLVRTGDTERARALHLVGYRAGRRNPSMAGEVGRHLEFCALTGNEARGMELLAENRTLFDEVDSPLELLDFLTGVEVLLRRVEGLGHGRLPASGWGGRSWTVASLLAEVRERADGIAARFDERNGTDAHARRRAARLEREPLLDSLELTLRGRALGDSADSAPEPPGELPESVTELVLRARELEDAGSPEADACWQRLRTLTGRDGYRHPDDPSVGPEVLLRADLVLNRAHHARFTDDHATAVPLLEEAAALYDEVGAPGQAAVARALALLSAAERTTDDGSREEAARAFGDAHAAVLRLLEEAAGLSPLQEARILLTGCNALVLRVRAVRDDAHTAEAMTHIARLDAFAERHGLESTAQRAALMRATVHVIDGELPAAAGILDAVHRRVQERGPAWNIPRVLELRGRVRLWLGDAEGAHADLNEALRRTAGWPHAGRSEAILRQDLAGACMRLGRPEDALRNLSRAAEQHLRHGRRFDGFRAYSEVASLTLALGRVEDCIALLDSVLAEPECVSGELHDRLHAQLRLTRARALHEGGDLGAAVAEFADLAAVSAGWDDDPGSHAVIAAETAVLLAESGASDRAREAADRALAAHARAPRHEKLSECLRELARQTVMRQDEESVPAALRYLEDAGRVLEEAREADDVEAEDVRRMEIALAHESGRVHAYAGEAEKAVAALEKALGLLGEPGEGAGEAALWAECVRLAALMEGTRLNRAEDALARLDAGMKRLRALGHDELAEMLEQLAGYLRSED